MLLLYCKAHTWAAEMKRRLREEKGSHIVEIAIAIAIAVGLAFIFRNEIAEFVENVFKRAGEAGDELSAGSITK